MLSKVSVPSGVKTLVLSDKVGTTCATANAGEKIDVAGTTWALSANDVLTKDVTYVAAAKLNTSGITNGTLAVTGGTTSVSVGAKIGDDIKAMGTGNYYQIPTEIVVKKVGLNPDQIVTLTVNGGDPVTMKANAQGTLEYNFTLDGVSTEVSAAGEITLAIADSYNVYLDDGTEALEIRDSKVSVPNVTTGMKVVYYNSTTKKLVDTNATINDFTEAA